MALTPSNMLPLHTRAPDFLLPDTEGGKVSLENFADKSLLVVAFICNHCPFVKHIRQELASLAKEYQPQSVGFAAINSNDTEAYPEDDMEHMRREVVEVGYSFPYLLDESQEVARAYDAACTPDFYLFNEERKLVYRGQLDDSRPGNAIPVTGSDLREALDAALVHAPVPPRQVPSMGCNIKWKAGNEPN